MAEVAELDFKVDRSSPVPLYFQVYRQLEDAIASGALPPGSRLENEIGMADRVGISRPTIRRAIQELVTKGLLVRQRGVGTQVVENAHITRQVQLTSLYDDLARSGRSPSTRVLTLERVAADDFVATHLGLDPGTEVVHFVRVRSADGEALAIMRNWLPEGVGGGLTAEDLRSAGLYELLRGRGVGLRVASQRIGARAATGSEPAMLGIADRVPLLTMERTTYDDAGRPVELGRHMYRADTYSFEVVVVDR